MGVKNISKSLETPVENVGILDLLAAVGYVRGYQVSDRNRLLVVPLLFGSYYLTALLKCCSNQDLDLERRTSLYPEDRGPSVRIPPRGLIVPASG